MRHFTKLPLATGEGGEKCSILGRNFVSEDNTEPAIFMREVAKENGVSLWDIGGHAVLHLLTLFIDIYRLIRNAAFNLLTIFQNWLTNFTRMFATLLCSNSQFRTIAMIQQWETFFHQIYTEPSLAVLLYLQFDVDIWFRGPELETDHVILLYLNCVPTHNITNIDYILVYLTVKFWVLRSEYSIAFFSASTPSFLNQSGTKQAPVVTWSMHDFPRLAPVSHFPALGIGYTFSRAWRRLHVFPVASLISLPIGSLMTGLWLLQIWRYYRHWKTLFTVPKKQFSNHNYSPENDVILVRDVVIPDLFVYKMTVDSFPSRVGQGLRGANYTQAELARRQNGIWSSCFSNECVATLKITRKRQQIKYS